MALVHVADGQDVPERAGVGRIPFPHAPAADDADARPVVGRRGLGRLGGLQLLALDEPERQAGHGGEPATALQKGAPRDVEGRAGFWRGSRSLRGFMGVVLLISWPCSLGLTAALFPAEDFDFHVVVQRAHGVAVAVEADVAGTHALGVDQPAFARLDVGPVLARPEAGRVVRRRC